MCVYWLSLCVCACVVYVPAQAVGGALQRPGEEGELSSKLFLIELFRVRRQQGQVLSERAQSVVTTTVDHVTERRLHHRHVLGQEVVFHLRTETGSYCFNAVELLRRGYLHCPFRIKVHYSPQI